jgi:hypothetical protein
MISKDIKELYDSGKIEELYKKHLKYFELIDKWADRLIAGDKIIILLKKKAR